MQWHFEVVGKHAKRRLNDRCRCRRAVAIARARASYFVSYLFVWCGTVSSRL